MSLVLVRLLSLAAFFGVLLAPGPWLRRRVLRAELGTPALDRLAEVVLALSAWTAALFALAAAQQLSPAAGWGLVVLALGAAGAERTRRGSPVVSPAPADGPGWRAWLALGVVATVLLGPPAVEAMTGAVSWDAGVYHLAVPKLWIAHGGFRAVPLLAYGSWPLGGELFFALAMLLDDFVLAKLVQCGFALLLLLALRAALPTHGVLAAGSAWLLILANPVLLSELPLAYIDVIQAFCLAAGLGFCALALREPGRRGSALVLAGLAGGLAAGMKLNGFVGTAILGAVALVGMVAQARRAGASPIREGLVPLFTRFAPPALALWAPWAVKSTLETGNPLYPVAHALFGGPDWSPALTDQLMGWQQGIGMGRGPSDWLLLPWRVVTQGGDGYANFDGELSGLWLVAVPLAAWAAWTGDRTARLGLGAGALFFLAWGLASQQLRLLIPGLPLLAIAAGAGLGRVQARVTRAGAGPWTGWALLAALVVGALAADTGRFPRAAAVADGLSLASRDADVAAAAPAVMRYLNRTLPDDAVVAFLNLNHRFHCDREVLADSFFEASQLAALLAGADTGAEVHRRLRARGVTHVLWAQRDWGIDWPTGLPAMATDPTLATVVHPGPSNVLLALVP